MTPNIHHPPAPTYFLIMSSLPLFITYTASCSDTNFILILTECVIQTDMEKTINASMSHLFIIVLIMESLLCLSVSG